MDKVSRGWASLGCLDPLHLPLASEAHLGSERSGRLDGCCRKGLLKEL